MLTITDYKNWALNDQRTAVALNDGGNALTTETARMGRVTRAICRGTVKQVRGDVLADFTRALSERYGESIAHEAISAAGLSPDRCLRGWKIMRAISAAKSIRAQMLRPAAEQNLTLGNTEVSAASVGVLMGEKGVGVAKFLKQRAVVVQLLGEMPLTQEEYADFQGRADKLVARLARLRDNAVIPESIPPADFQAAVNGLIVAVTERKVQLLELIHRDPLGAENLKEYRDVWRDAAINAMVDISSEAMNNGRQDASVAIIHAFTALCNVPRVRRLFDESIPRFSHDAAKNFVAPLVVRLLENYLTTDRVRDFNISKADMIRRINAGFQKNLNERPWVEINKDINASIGKRPVTLHSTISPAENIGRQNEGDRGPILSRYPASVHGYMCDSSTADHAVNLSVSSISVRDQGGAQTVAFKGVRHGVHSAWGIRDAQARAAANVRRAEEAVIAAFFVKYGGAGNNPPQLPQAGDDGTITVDLKMTSVSLLTPDRVRGFFLKENAPSNERHMLMEQSAAWDAVAQNGVEFTFNGQTIRIRPQILKFNFGVNEGAVSWSKIVKPLSGGWDVSGAMNRTAFNALGEEVNEFLQSDADQRTKDAALTLFNQCSQALDARAERRDAHDAFKVAARIAVLSNLIGKVPCWNCKSGKDRTGQMDVECKFLSTLIARGETIPEPGARLTDEQKRLFRSIALEGGNFEVQKMNTAIAGFKTGSVKSVTERLGGSEYRHFHRGGSDHVNV